MNTDYLLGRPLSLPAGTHLLADRDLIEDQWNIAWQPGRPEWTAEPFVLPPSSWEALQGPAKALYDRATGRYRMWYTVVHPLSYRHAFMRAPDPGPLPGAYCVGYAESHDGVHWRKPDLGVWTTPAGERTNIVFWGRHGGQMGEILENVPGGKARFALNYLDQTHGVEGICLAWSDDGFHWRPDAANPVLPCVSDCQNNILFSPSLERYVLLTRPHPHASGLYEWDSPGRRHTRRRIAVSTSANLRDWTPIRTALFPEPDDPADFDNMNALSCGNTHVGFLHTFDGDAGPEQHMTCHLAFSNDGLHWRRLRCEPFLAPGFSGQGFDERSVVLSGTCLPLGQEHLLLFYVGRARPAGEGPLSAPQRMAAVRLRRDGFACATPAAPRSTPSATEDSLGYLLTREFIAAGPELRLNADAARGTVRVEVVHRRTTKPWHGFTRDACLPIRDDAVAAKVRWREADWSSLAGRPVMLRLILEPGSRVYAMHLGTRNPE